jgi:hypothetical protein
MVHVFIDVICMYLRILVSNTISIKDVFVLFSTNMTGAKGGTGTAYSSGAPELKPTFFQMG